MNVKPKDDDDYYYLTHKLNQHIRQAQCQTRTSSHCSWISSLKLPKESIRVEARVQTHFGIVCRKSVGEVQHGSAI